MKFCRLLFEFCFIFTTNGFCQTQNIVVNSALGDNPHLSLLNYNAAGYTRDTRASIWLDDTGLLKFRSVTGIVMAFRNTQNTADLVVVTDNGMGVNTNYVPYGFQLAINGNALATSVTVRLRESWPDYVFDRKYHVIPLSELKTYISHNRYLPDVPTESEVEQKGINLGEMNKILPKKGGRANTLFD